MAVGYRKREAGAVSILVIRGFKDDQAKRLWTRSIFPRNDGIRSLRRIEQRHSEILG